MPLVSKIAQLGDDLLYINSKIADILALYFFETSYYTMSHKMRRQVHKY